MVRDRTRPFTILSCTVSICVERFTTHGYGTLTAPEDCHAEETHPGTNVETALQEDAPDGFKGDGISLLQVQPLRFEQQHALASGLSLLLAERGKNQGDPVKPNSTGSELSMHVDWWTPGESVYQRNEWTSCCPFRYAPVDKAIQLVGESLRARGQITSVAPSLVIVGVGDSGTRGVKQFLEKSGMKFCKYADPETEDNIATMAVNAHIPALLPSDGTSITTGYKTDSTAFRAAVELEQNAAALTLQCILHDNELPSASDWMKGIDAFVDNSSLSLVAPESSERMTSMIWGYKNPRHALLFPVMDTAFQDKSNYLAVARDPRDLCTAKNEGMFETFGHVINGKPLAEDCLLFWANTWSDFLRVYDPGTRLLVVRIEDLAVKEPSIDNNAYDVAQCVLEYIGLHPAADSIRGALQSLQEHQSSYMGHHYNFTDSQRLELESYVASRTQPALIHEMMWQLGYSPYRYQLLQPRSKRVCHRRFST